MVYPVGVVAALCLAVGYVLQQRAAATAPLAEVLHWRLLLDLLRRRTWLAGLAFAIVGQVLAAWALALAGLAVVEPLLSTNLLFAFAVASRLGRHRAPAPELIGAVLVSAALGGFLLAADPHRNPAPESPFGLVVVALAASTAVVLVLVVVGRRRGGRTEAVLLSIGAGILLGLQDAATRQALLGDWTHAFHSLWSLVVIGTAVLSLLLLQSAFRLGDLPWSLPPLVAAEPVAGIAVGVGVLGDRVDGDAVSILFQSLCLAGMVAGVVLVARSQAITSLARRPVER